MNTVWACLLLVGGFAVLWKCAELLVSGAVELARRFGISPLVIGLTVVAMGTSAPEVAASIAAAVADKGNVAIGNVYGSNIANLALVGGVCALIRPIRVRVRVLWREIPAMLLAVLLLVPILFDGDLSSAEGILLLVVFGVLIVVTIYLARKESGSEHEGGTEAGGAGSGLGRGKSLKVNILLIIIGLVGLAVGAKMSVVGAVFVGRKVGLSEVVIGLTIIAIGTSLPELVTCVVASVRGHDDISIGTLVGSNVFNALLAIGAAGAVRPFAVAARLAGVDYWIMLAVSGVFAVMAIFGRRIGRIDGVVLFGGYAGYLVYLLGYAR